MPDSTTNSSTPPPSRPGARTGAASRPRKAPRKPSPVPVFATMGLLFLGLFGLLGVRMAHGQDPALGPKKQVAAVQPHKVLVRKVVITKKITIIKPPKTVTPVASSGQSYTASTPAASAPAPAYTAPAQTYTPAPAPAPAPAPVATATS